jgi:transposase-like protein
VRQTTTAQLVEHKLGRSLPIYLKAQVMQGLGWRRIAEQLYRDTGVLVSHETLRSWHKKHHTDAAA